MPMPQFIGPSYALESRPASVQRTVNLIPVPIEPGNERTAWAFRDVPGLVMFNNDSSYLEDLPTDPYWPSTWIVAPLDESLTDYSPGARALTLYGGGAMTTTRSVHGTHAYENTSDDPASGFRCGTFSFNTFEQDIAIEMSAFFTTKAVSQVLFSIPGVCRIRYDHVQDDLKFDPAGGSGINTGYSPPLGSWIRIAARCRGSNGVNHDYAILVGGSSILAGSGSPYILSFDDQELSFGTDGSLPFIGGLSQARVTVTGVFSNRWYGSYTPPPMPLPRGLHPTLTNTGATGNKPTIVTGIATSSGTDFFTPPLSIYIPARFDDNQTDNGIAIAAHPEFEFGADDFNIRLHFKRLAESGGRPARLFTASVSGGTFCCYVSAGVVGQLRVEWYSSAGPQNTPNGVTCPAAVWHAVELRRVGTTLETLLDDVVVDAREITGGAASTVNCTGTLYFGREAAASTNPVNGYIDDIVITVAGTVVMAIPPAAGGF